MTLDKDITLKRVKRSKTQPYRYFPTLEALGSKCVRIWNVRTRESETPRAENTRWGMTSPRSVHKISLAFWGKRHRQRLFCSRDRHAQPPSQIQKLAWSAPTKERPTQLSPCSRLAAVKLSLHRALP